MTDIIAGLALVVAFISLYISWRAFRRDSSDLRVSLDFHLKTGQGTAFEVSVVNTGRRTTYIRKVSLYSKSGKESSYRGITSPIILEEAQHRDFLFPLYLPPLKTDFRSPLDVKRVEVHDTLGNKYTFPSTIRSRLSFFRLKRQIGRTMRLHPGQREDV